MNKPLTLIAIETGGNACSVALVIDGEIHLRMEGAALNHTRRLIPLMQTLLEEHGLSLQQLNGFAFGCGPGSFTGLRIAASFIQGLSFGLQIPVVGVSSLRAMAWHAHKLHQFQQVIPILDARMSEVYWGRYIIKENNAQLQGSEQVGAIDLIPEMPGFQRTFIEPDASVIAELAIIDFAQGLQRDAYEAMPVYIRNRVVN